MHAIDDQERTRANVIRDDIEGAVAVILNTECVSNCLNQVGKQIDFVIAMHALHDGSNAFKAQTCVDGWFR